MTKRMATCVLLALASLSGACHETAAPSPTSANASATATTTTTSGEARPSAPAVADTAPAWSPVVNGLRGRLIATPVKDPSGKPQVRLELVLDNVSDSAAPINLGWGNPSAV